MYTLILRSQNKTLLFSTVSSLYWVIRYFLWIYHLITGKLNCFRLKHPELRPSSRLDGLSIYSRRLGSLVTSTLWVNSDPLKHIILRHTNLFGTSTCTRYLVFIRIGPLLLSTQMWEWSNTTGRDHPEDLHNLNSWTIIK